MQFSIVVPAYNYAHYLKHNLDSLLAQSFQDFEIVVVDDGSTDQTQEVVAEYVKQYPQQIHYFYQQNAGPAAARNQGLARAKGDYLIFLDADDELAPNALKALANVIQNQQVDLIIGRHVTLGSNGQQKASIAHSVSTYCEANFLSYIRKKISMASGAYAVRKEALKNLSFPENLRGREDIVFFALMLANLSCIAVPDILLKRHKHDDSLRHALPDIEKVKLLPSLLFEHRSLPVSFQKYRCEFESRMYLSLFRQLYKAHEYKKARQFYIKAIQLYPKHIFIWVYLKRFLLSLFASEKL